MKSCHDLLRFARLLKTPEDKLLSSSIRTSRVLNSVTSSLVGLEKKEPKINQIKKNSICQNCKNI